MRFNIRIIISVLIAVLVISLVLVIMVPSSVNVGEMDFYIEDTNNDYQYEVGEDLEFSINDSSLMDKPMIWHFGNGDTLMGSKNIKYKYKTKGKYMITLELDSKYKVSKYIDIVSIPRHTAVDSIATIYGEEIGYVGEQLIFSSYGPGVTSWYWEFGETGTVDAYEGQVVYVYKDPGMYTVTLKTNIATYPVQHQIQILSLFEAIEESEPIDSMQVVINDLILRFQAIADTDMDNKTEFYKNLKYIESKYTCAKAEEVVVVVNDEKYNDLYSYCQGLHSLEGKGERTLIIKNIVVDAVRCITRIEVTQNIIEKY